MRVVATLLLVLAMSACSENGGPTESVSDNGESPQPGSSASEPKSVKDLSSYDTLKESIVKSLAADWDISEDDSRCLLRDHRATQLSRVDTDPEIQAVFEKCGVDPSVVK
jgi:hypothetical protein